MTLLLSLTAGWLILAAAAGILLGRGIRLGDEALNYDTDGYRAPDVDAFQRIAA